MDDHTRLNKMDSQEPDPSKADIGPPPSREKILETAKKAARNPRSNLYFPGDCGWFGLEDTGCVCENVTEEHCQALVGEGILMTYQETEPNYMHFHCRDKFPEPLWKFKNAEECKGVNTDDIDWGPSEEEKRSASERLVLQITQRRDGGWFDVEDIKDSLREMDFDSIIPAWLCYPETPEGKIWRWMDKLSRDATNIHLWYRHPNDTPQRKWMWKAKAR